LNKKQTICALIWFPVLNRGTERKSHSDGFRDPHRQDGGEGGSMDGFMPIPKVIGGALERA
jgi:hypothetical protein